MLPVAVHTSSGSAHTGRLVGRSVGGLLPLLAAGLRLLRCCCGTAVLPPPACGCCAAAAGMCVAASLYVADAAGLSLRCCCCWPVAVVLSLMALLLLACRCGAVAAVLSLLCCCWWPVAAALLLLACRRSAAAAGPQGFSPMAMEAAKARVGRYTWVIAAAVLLLTLPAVQAGRRQHSRSAGPAPAHDHGPADDVRRGWTPCANFGDHSRPHRRATRRRGTL